MIEARVQRIVVLLIVGLANTALCDDVQMNFSQNQNVTDELQAAIDGAADGVERKILVNSGRFYLSRTIVFPPGKKIKLLGSTTGDTKFKVSTNWNQVTKANKPCNIIFALLGCDGCAIKHVQINGNNAVIRANRPNPYDPGVAQIGILLSGANHCDIYKVDIINVGRSRRLPGGSHVLLMAADGVSPVSIVSGAIVHEAIEGGRAAAEYKLRQDGKNCSDNTVRRCKLIDVSGRASYTVPVSGRSEVPGMTQNLGQPYSTSKKYWDVQASFGVRVLTNWESANVPNVSAKRNEILENTFAGFFWNGIEIAGPKTTGNKIKLNKVLIGFQSSVEADKGASDNIFYKNEIDHIYSHNRLRQIDHDQWSTDEYTAGPRSNVFAFRDQGYSREGVVHPCTGNTFDRCKVFHLEGLNAGDSGVFRLNESQNVMITNSYLPEAPANLANGMVLPNATNSQHYAIRKDVNVTGFTDTAAQNNIAQHGRYKNGQSDIDFITP